MTAFVAAFLADLDDQALDELARRLAPRLAAHTPALDGPLTTRQAATLASVHERTVRRALAAGTLPGSTVAGRWRINPADLTAWVDAGAPTQTAATVTNGRHTRGAATAGADAIARGRLAA